MRNSETIPEVAVRRSETVARKCSVKTIFFKILQYSQENTYAEVSF